MTRVRVAAASPVIRAGLEALLARAADIELIDARGDDASVADVIIADRAGMEASAATSAADPSQALVLLLDSVSAEWPAALRAGAHAVLAPDATGEEILAAVRAAAAGLLALPVELTGAVLEAARRERTSSGPEPLSPREREVLAMMAEGLGNKTIAARLGISRHTVKAHVSSILAKLEASSRAEAIVIGARMGLIVL